MDQDDPMTDPEMPVNTTSPPEKGVHPVRRVVQAIRYIGNQPLVMRVKWLLAGMLIFAASVVITQVQFNDSNAAKREIVEDGSKSRDYILELSNWTTAKISYDACQIGVAQSVGNRAWKTWLLDKLDSLTPPDDDVANDFITEGRAKLDELVPAVDPATCVDPGPQPDPPPEFNPGAIPPPQDPRISVPEEAPEGES